MRYGKMRQVYDNLKENNQKFLDFDNSKKKNFGYYSIMPIQRLPRYKLIIKGLIKETPGEVNEPKLLFA